MEGCHSLVTFEYEVWLVWLLCCCFSLKYFGNKTDLFTDLVSVFAGVSVLLRNLLSAYLQGVQYGPSYGPHLRLPARRRAGLQDYHHPAAGRCTTGTTGCAGEQ